MSSITLYHGSTCVVEAPCLALGRPTTDYGKGFYCTQDLALASEWACDGPTTPGFVNEYRLDLAGLTLVDLDCEPYSVLNWVAILLANRGADGVSLDSAAVKKFVEAYQVNLQEADVACGYRADDSYFSIARHFLNNAISVDQLERALRLGGLGRQVVMKSEKAFGALAFERAHAVQPSVWYVRRAARDEEARRLFREMLRNDQDLHGELFIDIVRGL